MRARIGPMCPQNRLTWSTQQTDRHAPNNAEIVEVALVSLDCRYLFTVPLMHAGLGKHVQHNHAGHNQQQADDGRQI